MIFADAQTPDAQHFLQFWLILILIGQGLGVVFMVVNFFSNRKQRREVSFQFEPASKVEFDKHVQENKHEHENLFRKMGGVERGAGERLTTEVHSLRSERKEDMRQLHHEVNEVSKKVAGLETATRMQNEQLAEIRKAQSELPGEIIATLKNAK